VQAVQVVTHMAGATQREHIRTVIKFDDENIIKELSSHNSFVGWSQISMLVMHTSDKKQDFQKKFRENEACDAFNVLSNKQGVAK